MTTKVAAIYARVSTTDQDADVQVVPLREYVVRRGWALADEHIYVDKGVSGSKESRRGLDGMLEAARRRRIDVVIVWALDRLGRSLKHLVMLAEELGALGVDLVCLTQPIDTTTPAGRLTFAVLGAVAEFERQMCVERVKAGIAKARASGKRLGRPRAHIDAAEVRARLVRGESLRGVARSLGVHHATLVRVLGRERGAESGSPTRPPAA
jgi:DNA invertase Pin-like site-specific DNA recombinase